jgi:hypothetical protein
MGGLPLKQADGDMIALLQAQFSYMLLYYPGLQVGISMSPAQTPGRSNCYESRHRQLK